MNSIDTLSPQITSEQGWWVNFHARVECCQHSGLAKRVALINQVMSSELRHDILTLSACINLGLLNEAWNIHRDHAGIFRDRKLVASIRAVLAIRYAQTILQPWLQDIDEARPRSAVHAFIDLDELDVAIVEDAWHIIGILSSNYSEAFSILSASIAHSQLRSWVLPALGVAAGGGNHQAARMIIGNQDIQDMSRNIDGLNCLSVYTMIEGSDDAVSYLSSLILDLSNKHRRDAMVGLWGAAARDYPGIIEILSQLISNTSDPDRCGAIEALDIAVKWHSRKAFISLLNLAMSEPRLPVGVNDLIAECSAVKSEDESDLMNEVLVQELIEQLNNPKHDQSFETLGKSAKYGDSAAEAALGLIALDVNDPRRERAISELDRSAWRGRPGALAALCRIACDPSDPMSDKAILALYGATDSAHPAAVEALRAAVHKRQHPHRATAVQVLGSADRGRGVSRLALACIAMHPTDPVRKDAIRGLAQATESGSAFVIGILLSIAASQSDAEASIAAEVLKSAVSNSIYAQDILRRISETSLGNIRCFTQKILK